MSTRNRVFVGILLIYVLGVTFLLYRIVADLDPRYRESAEESLVETSNLLASFLERDLAGGEIRGDNLRSAFRSLYARNLNAQIFELNKTRIDLRVYVTDGKGRVVFDSRGLAEGQDYSAWRDVQLTLRGEYGARTTRDIADDPRTSVMYVAAPLHHQGKIVGVVTVGKPVQSFGQFVDASRRKILEVGIGSVAAILLLVLIVSIWLVRPSAFASNLARHLRAQRKFSLSGLFRYVVQAVVDGYREMRDALAGRQQVSEYVQTLTHEIKSPLSAIRGAAELLQETMPESERQRFLANIVRESQRIQGLVDRLLELSALETRHRLDRVESVDLRRIVDESVQTAQPVAKRRGIVLSWVQGEPVLVEGDAFLLQRAVSNLIENAIDFSDDGGAVDIALQCAPEDVEVHIRDYGAGIPEYAHARLFEKFFSLARPHSNKKSSGLGLAFVREVAQLHHGRVSLQNAHQRGAIATLRLPRC